jgi:hypothetical protein
MALPSRNRLLETVCISDALPCAIFERMEPPAQDKKQFQIRNTQAAAPERVPMSRDAD